MHFGTKSALTDAAFWAFVLKKSIFLFLIKRKKIMILCELDLKQVPASCVTKVAVVRSSSSGKKPHQLSRNVTGSHWLVKNVTCARA